MPPGAGTYPRRRGGTEESLSVAQREFVIITGMSGAGKSLTMKCFEDLGYFCVDNLPPALIPKFAQLCGASSVERLALVIDIRGREFFPELQGALAELPRLGFEPFILYLEASDEVLVRRYSETRRQHPLTSNGRVLHGIQEERGLLKELRTRADWILDTSRLSPHRLRADISRRFSAAGAANRASIHVVSFGFKYGVPLDADMVLDVRFLPNPYYVEDLNPLSGLDEPVREYLFAIPAAEEFAEKVQELLEFLLPRFLDEGKHHMTLAFGCTGGRHRSTAMAEAVADRLRELGHSVSVEHRDVLRTETALAP